MLLIVICLSPESERERDGLTERDRDLEETSPSPHSTKVGLVLIHNIAAATNKKREGEIAATCTQAFLDGDGIQ
jgi:hypothetical protein